MSLSHVGYLPLKYTDNKLKRFKMQAQTHSALGGFKGPLVFRITNFNI